MKKYKQTIIPNVEEKQFEGKKLGDIKRYVKDFYNKNFKGKSVKNKQKGITIKFSAKGLSHVLYARRAGYTKYKAITVLDEMLKYAEFLNFKSSDIDDPVIVLGYLNFKSKVIVENKMQYFKLVVRLTNTGNFFYDHSVKVKK